METLLQILSGLVLTLLGFVVPVVGIMFSIFHRGLKKLSDRYESEKLQSEDNIKAQIRKIGDEGKEKKATIDEDELQKNLDELKDIKKSAEKKLARLKPRKQILKLFIPLTLSLILIAIASITNKALVFDLLKLQDVLLFSSLIPLIYALVVLWQTLEAMLEAKAEIDAEDEENRKRHIELLSSIYEEVKSGASHYLHKVYIIINGTKVGNKNLKVELKSDEESEIEIWFANSEKKMAKNIEVGLLIPQSFIVHKGRDYTVYADKKENIIRYKDTQVQANTKIHYSSLSLTPLEKGKYEITTFIKGQNIEMRYDTFTINVS